MTKFGSLISVLAQGEGLYVKQTDMNFNEGRQSSFVGYLNRVNNTFRQTSITHNPLNYSKRCLNGIMCRVIDTY